MLTRLHVRGYKALETLSATFEPLTIVAGPNGCGKTSLIDAIMMVRDFVMLPTDAACAEHPFLGVRSSGGKPAAAVGAELWAKVTERNQYRSHESVAYQGLVEELSDPHGGQALRAWLEYSSDERPSVAVKLVPSSFVNHEQQREVVNACLGQIRRLDFDVHELRRPSYSSELVPTLSEAGAGLATVLSWLHGEKPERFAEIQAQLQELIPEVKRLRFRRAMVDEPTVGKTVVGEELVFDYRHSTGIPASHASEGTLLILGLITVLLTEKVSVLLLDHFERALHPQAQRHLVQYLRSVTEWGVQIITTTPSPFFLMNFEPVEMRAMVSTEGGAWMGKFSSLAKRPEYERWQDEMNPSELRAVLGQDWLSPILAGVVLP